ncbi:aldo/keto reductase [Leifsonia sp. LS-T14]|uniref:aldo/keto reductase n=1 Tax=unclassified Leifsonia TaxID=2663824 RepID=UPI0035A60FD9
MNAINSLAVRSVKPGQVLTEIGLGAAQFGNLYRETTDAASAAAVTAALEGGVRYFDTAPHYGLGLSERRLGRALAGVERRSVAISTKVGRLIIDSPESAGRLDDEGFVVPADRRRVWDFSRDGVLRSIESSMRRLGVDRVDIAYLHDPDDHWAEASTTGIATLVELRDQGVVGAIGAGMNQSAMLTDFVRQTDVDVVMVAGRFTLLEQGALHDLLPAAAERGVGVVAAAVYNSGLLSNPVVPDGSYYDYDRAPAEVVRRARRIAAVCESHGVLLPEAAVQYPLRHPAVASVVVGTRTAEQVVGTLARYRSPIPEDLWAELAESGLAPDPADPDR